MKFFNYEYQIEVKEIELNKTDGTFVPILNDTKLTELNGLLETYDSQILEKNDAVKAEMDKLNG